MSGAPGNTAAIPTMAIWIGSGMLSALERGGLGAHVHHLRLGAAGQLGEQAGDAVLGLDQANASPGVLALEFGGDHPGPVLGGCPRSPVDRDHPAAGPRRPD